MHKYCVEVMLRGYAAGPKISFEAANDAEACTRGWELAKAQFGCIAYSVSHRIGRRKVYVSP
jgi:hypothetical protein